MGWFIAAVIAAGLGLWMLYRARSADRQVGELLGVETFTTAHLREMHQVALDSAGPGAYSERIELEGTVQPGPGGVLSSPVSQAECVWHQHKVTRHYEDVRRDKDGNRRTQKRQEKITNEKSSDSFLLLDSTGDIVIVPVDGVKQARKSVSEFRAHHGDSGSEISLGSFSFNLGGGRGGTTGFEYEEWILPVGTKVFLSGQVVDRNGTLEVRAPEGGDLLISTRSEEELLEKGRKDQAMSAKLGYGGLALGAVLAVVGVVLLVV